MSIRIHINYNMYQTINHGNNKCDFGFIYEILLTVFIYYSWSKLLSHIWNLDANTPVNLPHSDKLKDKERYVIKERFAVS